MEFNNFSLKQMKTLAWWMPASPVQDRDAVICDGAVRSGKTLTMSMSFILWAMASYRDQNFAICGKTITSCERNVISPLIPIIYEDMEMRASYSRARGWMEVTDGVVSNRFYIFGGKDEGSAALIQGVTLAGVLLDEVALMPRSFVEQALARCSVDGARFWFNCNPENPNHWFYNEWIKKTKSKNVYYLHWLMDDNPSLSEKTKQRYKNLFTGTFYERYILGRWVPAEGQIYPIFNSKKKKIVIDKVPPGIMHVNIGVDFGGNKSATMFVATGFTKGYKQVVCLEEEMREGAIDNPETLAAAFVKFCRRIKQKYPMAFYSYCDSAEQILIRGLDVAVKRDNTGIQVVNALKTEITGRIRLVNSLMAQDRFKVMRGCKELITALQVAVWDDKALEDVRLDNGTYNVDVLDACEYSIEPVANFLQVLR